MRRLLLLIWIPLMLVCASPVASAIDSTIPSTPVQKAQWTDLRRSLSFDQTLVV